MLRKKMRHDNVNVHQKFNPNSCINEGARKINLLRQKVTLCDLQWPQRSHVNFRKKMCHDNVNVHQKFHPNSYVNEGARKINLFGHKSDLMWPSMTSEVTCHFMKEDAQW